MTSDQRHHVFTDEQWKRIEPLLPSNEGKRARPFENNRRIVEGIAYRYRAGIAWRDLPREHFGPWRTVWKRHRRYASDGTWDRVLAQILADADAAGDIDWNVSVDGTINRAHQHATNTSRPDQDTGATSNYKNLADQETEPAGHGIGRSRGGLTTKIHHAVDGRGRPLAIVITGGQRHDGVILPEVLADIRVPRVGPGRARTRPDSVLADRAYGSSANREYLRARGVKAVIPEKSTQITARKNRGHRGGRRPAFNAIAYRNRNVVERSFAYAKQWRGLATRYDKLAIVYRAAVVISAILTWLRQ
ncbi:MAG: IS5 family transposase [Brevibacterium aurantiacum]|uniref:IS5 family transposase n=1 Tax=Brevibacterium aurantiacum TaxID=273384 RepID=UPI001C69EE7B|nr:IS5 family transposase [Brevibacterium aurantiacum]